MFFFLTPQSWFKMFLAQKLLGGLVNVIGWEFAQSLFIQPNYLHHVSFLSCLTCFFSFFKATLTPPSLFPPNLWVTSTIETALSDWRSGKLTCVSYLVKPPPRRPAVYAEQNESDEERQFRKVFQQLAGDVSTVPQFFTLLNVFLLIPALTFRNPCCVGYGSEPSGADEHPQQNHLTT